MGSIQPYEINEVPHCAWRGPSDFTKQQKWHRPT